VHSAPLSPAQEAFICCPETEVLGVGPRGGTKTHALIQCALSEVGRGWGRNYAAIIFRQNQGQLRDVVKTSEDLIRPIWPSAQYNKNDHVWTWPTGETLEFYHFESMADAGNVQGREFAFVGWEELCLWANPECYLVSFAVLRSTAVAAMPRRIRATANPLGPGHGWVKHRFRLRGVPDGICGPAITDSMGEDGKPEMPRRWVSFPYTDNVLMRRHDPKYQQKIATACKNNPARLQSWTRGNWDALAGGAVDEIFYEHRDKFCIDEFDIPPGFMMFMSYDDGRTKPFSVGFWAVSDGSDIYLHNGKCYSTRRGDLFRVGEIYGCEKGQPNVGIKMTVPDINRAITAYKLERGWKYQDHTGRWIDMCKRGVADTSLWDQQHSENTIADEFEHPVSYNGVRHGGIRWDKCVKGKNSIADGLALLIQRLLATAQQPREERGLYIVEKHNTDWLRTVAVLQRDEDDTDKIAEDQEDHSFDETRYALSYEGTHPGVISYRRQVW
jgi:hypothetical protein